MSGLLNSRLVALLVASAVSVGFQGCLVGCASANSDKNRDNLATLERGNFQGEINLQSDGSVEGGFVGPLFRIGPSNSLLQAHGNVDFSQHKGSETTLSDEFHSDSNANSNSHQ